MTDLDDRLTEVITVLDQLDITAALTGIHQSLPGWPSGGRGGTPDIDPTTGEPFPALTKVEAVALTRDAAMTALAAYPRICAAVLRASEAVSTLRASSPVTDPARAVLMSSALLREAQKRTQPLHHRTLQPLWNHTMTLRNETLRWAAITRPATGATPKGVGLVDTDPKWCTSCLRLGHCEPRYGSGTLCRKCQNFYRAEGALPPTTVLAKWHRGERVTSKDIAPTRAR
jgi:hypothetical protein